MFVSHEIHGALLETARYVAKYSYLNHEEDKPRQNEITHNKQNQYETKQSETSRFSRLQNEEGKGEKIVGKIIDSAFLKMQFSKCVKESNLWGIKGGASGVSLLQSECNREDHLLILRAQAKCKIVIPLIGAYFVPIREVVYQKAFLGYAENGNFQNGEYVYVAEYGEVYHTNPSCTHISIQIIPVRELVHYAEKRKCKHCMENGEITGDYVTLYGDCIHSDINCSGLKRTVHLFHKDEIGKLALCSKCAQTVSK